MVDLAIQLSPKQAAICTEKYGISPGEWMGLESDGDKTTFFNDLKIEDLLNPNGVPINDGRARVSAGSSILGMFSSMPPFARAQSGVITAIPSKDQRIDPLFNIFRGAVTDMGSFHTGTVVEGSNPLGIVLSQKELKEKMLVTFTGSANELANYDRLDEHCPEFILVDSYELRKGKIATYINEVIRSRKYKVALSLGNQAILDVDLAANIREYIHDGLLEIVCGNEEEFTKLYPEYDTGILGIDEFMDHPIKDNVPYVMLTRGVNGISSLWQNSYYNHAAVPVPQRKIFNTSGAGDTAMGSFCYGVMFEQPPRDTLSRAVTLASKVIQTHTSRIISEY